MTMSRMQLLSMCRNFFLFTVFLTIFVIWGFFYAYSIYKIFGLILLLFASTITMPYFFKNTYIIIADISKMDTDSFEGKIERIEYSKFRDILPCGILIFNKKNEREKSGTYHLNVKIRARVGSWVKIQYLKKSRIIIDYEVIKY
ncbi:hypothetical protein FRZ06_13710 [Anoxybacterium hadale]|uniref:Uncharacterized protein n=1 Tax=Anoxybacterium hadale TaxID=3408580 RepID=A0ACD1ADE1_9FIRM|nr:hypothetical protein FRZ06_13710 [Clostridiales bacterium]